MTATTSQTRRVVVLGVGNVLLSDEGIGVHVAEALAGTPSNDSVALEVVDGGTLPEVPLSFEDVDKLIIVDAVKAGDEPGAIYCFRPEDVEMENKSFASLHQITLLDNLWLMEKFSQRPEDIVIIGIEPENIDCGLELSERLRERLPRIIEIVLEEAGLENPAKPEKGA